MRWNEIFNLLRCKVEQVLQAVSGFNNPFSSSFVDNETVLSVFLSFGQFLHNNYAQYVPV